MLTFQYIITNMSDIDDISEFEFDVSSMLGMSSVLNRDETDSGLNLKAMEKTLFKEVEEEDNGYVPKDNIMTGEKENSLEYDPLEEYNNLISKLEHGSDDEEELQINNYNTVETNDMDYPSYSYNIDTEEQESQKTINSYFSNDSNNYVENKLINNSSTEDNKSWDYSNILEEENRDDMKLRLLEKIDNLKEELEDDGINLSKIPSVDFSSKLEDIENTAKLLMLKATRNRYSNMGEEFILAISNGLEILCNGKREFFGVKPDLTNCTDIVKVKLRRVKNETSQIVADVVEKYEIPPLFTVLIELVPALFLHSQRRSRQKTLCVDLSDDINEIRKYD